MSVVERVVAPLSLHPSPRVKAGVHGRWPRRVSGWPHTCFPLLHGERVLESGGQPGTLTNATLWQTVRVIAAAACK